MRQGLCELAIRNARPSFARGLRLHGRVAQGVRSPGAAALQRSLRSHVPHDGELHVHHSRGDRRRDKERVQSSKHRGRHAPLSNLLGRALHANEHGVDRPGGGSHAPSHARSGSSQRGEAGQLGGDLRSHRERLHVRREKSTTPFGLQSQSPPGSQVRYEDVQRATQNSVRFPLRVHDS